MRSLSVAAILRLGGTGVNGAELPMFRGAAAPSLRDCNHLETCP